MLPCNNCCHYFKLAPFFDRTEGSHHFVPAVTVMFHKVSSWRCISTAIIVESATSRTWSRKRHAMQKNECSGFEESATYLSQVEGVESWGASPSFSSCRTNDTGSGGSCSCARQKCLLLLASIGKWWRVEVLQPYKPFAMPQFFCRKCGQNMLIFKKEYSHWFLEGIVCIVV